MYDFDDCISVLQENCPDPNVWLQKFEPRKDLISSWVAKGLENPWIKKAWDPPFNNQSFVACGTPLELATWFWHGNWSLGSAFIFANLCFINQVDGGDEWLVIRDDIVFESITAKAMLNHETFKEWIERVLKATEKQLKELTY